MVADDLEALAAGREPERHAARRPAHRRPVALAPDRLTGARLAPRPGQTDLDYFRAAGFFAAGFLAAGFFAAGFCALGGRLGRGLRGRGDGDRRVDDLRAGRELLHRCDAGQGRALRLVGLARRDNLAVGREETEAELAGRAFLDDELSGHGCLSFRGVGAVRGESLHAGRKAAAARAVRRANRKLQHWLHGDLERRPARGRARDRVGRVAGHVCPCGPSRQQPRHRVGRRRIPPRRGRRAGLLRRSTGSARAAHARASSSRETRPRRRSTRTSPPRAAAERITGWPVSWKWAVAWRFGESSQQRITPHCVQSRRCTQVLPIAMQASHTRTSGNSVCSIVSRWVQESLTSRLLSTPTGRRRISGERYRRGMTGRRRQPRRRVAAARST